MNIVQFTPSIGELSGREYMMKRIAKNLNAPVYTVSKKFQENENKKIVTNYKKFKETLNSVGNISLQKNELEEADLIISHSALSPLILSDINTPLMLMNHGFFKEFTTLFSEVTNIIDDTHEFLVRQDIQQLRNEMKNILSQADILVANSKYVQKQIHRWFGLDSVVIYDPIDWKFYKPTNKDGDYFLWVGRQYWLKRPEVALKAFNSIDEKLHIVGESGAYKNSILEYSQSEKSITHHEYVSKQKLRELYNGANALIHTSYDEDCPTVIREAMACKTPSIAVDIEANKEVMQGTGTLYNDDKNIIKNLSEKVKYSEPSTVGLRKQARKFSMKNFEERMRSVIQASDV